LNLRDVRGRDEFVKAVETAAQGKKKGEWVLGGRWSVESWKSPETPRATWLDPITGETPVFLSRMDGHEALANSAALKLAGIDKSGPGDPVGGEIERDPTTREPTGILKESAMDLVHKLIPKPSAKERYAALLRAMRHANSLGDTSVHDMSQLADMEAFKQAQATGELTVRITSYLNVDDWSKYSGQIAEMRLDMDSKLLHLAGFKGFMDGSMGSRNAYMFESYADAAPQSPYPRGQLTAFAASAESFQKQVADADARGLQLAVHAIGDQANHLLLDAYESAMKKNDTKNPRHRIEHAQHLLVDDIPRFAKLGVTASMQPYHKADDGRYAEKALGSDRLQGSYAFRRLVDAGALLIFGSDWPVVTMNPFDGMDSAVNAKTLAGEVWLPSHSLTTEEALRAYTVLPPRAIRREATLGVLEAPKFADFVILKDDPLTIPSDRLGRVRVSQVVVAGKVVFTAPE
jgi:predicted amidohydrolase YtcJ